MKLVAVVLLVLASLVAGVGCQLMFPGLMRNRAEVELKVGVVDQKMKIGKPCTYDLGFFFEARDGRPDAVQETFGAYPTLKFPGDVDVSIRNADQTEVFSQKQFGRKDLGWYSGPPVGFVGARVQLPADVYTVRITSRAIPDNLSRFKAILFLEQNPKSTCGPMKSPA